MLIIGCDFHSGFQQIAIFDNQTGEIQEKKLLHPERGGGVLSRTEAGRFGWAWKQDVLASGSGGC